MAALALAAAEAAAQITAGPEFRANTYTTGRQFIPRLAMEEDGDFVVVWHTPQPGDIVTDLIGQRFSRTGAPLGGEFQVNTYTTGEQVLPKLAFNRKGDFVVVWMSYEGAADYEIKGQRFNATGARVGVEFQVNTYTMAYQGQPAVAMDARGNFMVAWESYGQDGSDDGVFARRYDRNGVAQGDAFQVNQFTPGPQETVEIDVTPDGNRFIVVWESLQPNGLDDVFGQLFDGSGNRVGSEFLVNTSTTSIEDEPVVGMAANGSFVVAWESDFGYPSYQDVLAQRFDPAGNRVGAELVVNTYTFYSQFIYSLAVDDQGRFVVAWDAYGPDGSGYGIRAQRVDADGSFRGTEFAVNTYTTGYQGFSFVKGDGVGNFVVAWLSRVQDGDSDGIFGQRFGGVVPATLAVDTGAGNLVWEPGESVPVQPGWRNVNGAPQTFQGQLSGLTGPPGATYTLGDASADYGTVANDTVGTCTSNCYSVSVSNPSPRPVPHWDASALEALLFPQVEQQKRWALHIGRSFNDVQTTSPFYRFIETIFHFGITTGCGGGNYCPGDSTARDQMSVFMLVGKEGAGYAPPPCAPPNVFTDVPETNPFCPFIEELFNRGVVGGCGPGPAYCPSNPVTREQIAVFVLRTLDPTFTPPPCLPPNTFGDVPETSPFCPWIEELARRGVVGGCGSGNYCPTLPVTREQMAVFIAASFGLTLYGP
jgi:hypothetical protein